MADSSFKWRRRNLAWAVAGHRFGDGVWPADFLLRRRRHCARVAELHREMVGTLVVKSARSIERGRGVRYLSHA